MSTTAYTPVTVRRTLTSNSHSLAHPGQAPSNGRMAPAPVAEKKKIAWPQQVRDYVQRCFAPECLIDGITRAEMENRLKRIITEATEKDALFTTDWDHLPLPQEMIRNEKRTSLLANSITSWMPPPPVSATVPASVSFPSTSPNHKRKSSELVVDADGPNGSAAPPWRQTPSKTSFADRVTAPPKTEKRQKLDDQRKLASKSDLEKRSKRFDLSRSSTSHGRSRSASPRPENNGPVVGRCQNLEKNYFRLTAPPNPDTVRPLPILKQTLELLKKKWKTGNNYTYICDQFKSLRQDLTVQHVKNDFTVSVYEIHARIALEKGDLGEYNQCQTQLRALYKQKLGGHPMEFLAYRILYFIHTCNRSDMNDVLADLTPTDKTDRAVKHALDVRSALALGNYHRFFQLYLDTPNMGAYLMDMFVSRERLAALASICRSYKPDVKIRFITEELGFESDEESARFVLEYGPEDLLQERDGGVRLLTGKAGNIFETARKHAFAMVDLKGQI